ncbi:MAG: hypothetical protein RI894_2027, partial [Bacteroidota bacterium]
LIGQKAFEEGALLGFAARNIGFKRVLIEGVPVAQGISAQIRADGGQQLAELHICNLQGDGIAVVERQSPVDFGSIASS